MSWIIWVFGFIPLALVGGCIMMFAAGPDPVPVDDAAALRALIAPPAVPVCVIDEYRSLAEAMTEAGMSPRAGFPGENTTLVLLRDPDGAYRNLYLPIQVRPGFHSCDVAGLDLVATDRPGARVDLIDLDRAP